jgi:hypothetical protein
MYSSTLSLTPALDEGGWSTTRFTPGKETRYPLYRRLGGPQGRSGRVRKISPPPGFDSRTVQPVASRYTDYAILGATRGWVISTTPQPLFSRERPGTHCTGGWVGLEAGLDGTENFSQTEIRFPHLPVRSESLYRRRYCGRNTKSSRIV